MISPAEKFARIAVLLAIACLFGCSVWAASGLYADGSFFALKILERKQIWLEDGARIYGHYLTQAPLLAAIAVGMDELHVLTRLHTAGLQIVLLIWAGALIAQWRDRFFWTVLLCFCVTYLTSGFFIIGEYNFAAALTGLSAALLMREGPLGVPAAFMIVLCAFGLFRAYETTAFLGPMLIVFCISRKELLGGVFALPTLLLILTIGLLIVGSAIAIHSILYPLKQYALSGAMNVMPLLRSSHSIYLGVIGALVALALVARGWRYSIIVAFGIIVSIAYIVKISWWNPPVRHYDFRALSGLFLFVVLGLSLLYIESVRRGWMSRLRQPSVAAPIVAACFVALTIPFVSHLFEFRAWAADFETQVLDRRGIVSIEQTSLTPSPYIWNWTNPSLSAVLKGHEAGAIIENPSWYKDWVPFSASATPSILFEKRGRLYRIGS